LEVANELGEVEKWPELILSFLQDVLPPSDIDISH